ncbi:tetratricopeptide repeat protein [bacterium]|nr:tetratricopeptide repeat protein [bacterium]
MRNSNIFSSVFLFLLIAGCLQTRSNLRGQPATTAPAVSPQQQKAAEEAIKKQDTDSEFRQLYGRLETVEKQVADVKDNVQVKALENRIVQMETEMNLLRATISELNAKAKKDALLASSDEQAKKQVAKSPLFDASKHFNDKKWEDAILAYEEYRKKNPKGSDYAEATLKIGLCFQNMGLKDDAKVFFKEVVEKYPKSKEADTAKSKLKKL